MSQDTLSTTLLSQLRAARPEAWERLAYLYGPIVIASCRRLGVAASDTDDLLQEVFTACARGLPGFRRDRAGDSFGGWLATITRNKVRDHFRKAGKQFHAAGGTEPLLRLNQVADEQATASLADSDSPESQRRLVVHRATELVRGEFEEPTWAAFRLTTTDNLSPAEAAERLGVSVNAVYKARSRVLRRLREELVDVL